jgi:hypothetical protein
MRQAGQGYGYSSPAYTGSDTSCTIDILDDSVEHCFVVRAFDTDGNESPDSNEVCKAAASVAAADVDDDGDGYTENQGDCNDGNAATNPSAREVCGDTIDQNCDGIDMVCQAPDADAGPDQRTAVGGEVLLNGSNSTSASGGALSYSWRQTAGDQVQLIDAQSSTLRHYGASKLAQEGVPLTDIQALLGHQRATTTDIYLQSLGFASRLNSLSKLVFPV